MDRPVAQAGIPEIAWLAVTTRQNRKRGLFRSLGAGIGRALAAGFVQTEIKNAPLALRRELQKRATAEAADIVRADMPEALFCADRMTNLDYALSLRKDSGLMLEFGVYKGGTITHAARSCPDETIYGFDSFQGLPEQWHGKRFSRSNFDRGGALPEVPGNVRLIKGWFDETLPTFLQQNPGPVSFVHIDCDLYSSTAFVLAALQDRLSEHCVVVFDEFFNYHGFRLHEYKAFYEFIERSRRSFSFASFSGEQVTVVLGK